MDANSTQASEQGSLLTYIFTSALAYSIILFSGFSFVMIPLSKTLPSRQKVMFTSVSLTDVCAGAMFLNITLLPIKEYDSSGISCQIILPTGMTIVYATLFLNFLITVERFLSISFPLSTKVTWQKLLLAAIIAWMASIIISIATFSEVFSGMPYCGFIVYGYSFGYLFMSITGLFVFFAKIILYGYIVKVTRRHLRQIASTMVVVAAENDGRRHLNKAEVRSTVTVGIILGCFGISYLPLYLFCLYTSIFVMDKDEFLSINKKVFMFLKPTFLINSLINPFVYIWRLRNCRKEFIARMTCRTN